MRSPLLLLALCLLALPLGSAQSQKPENKGWDQLLPPGKGREIVLNSCTTCHGLKIVVHGRKSGADWQKAVNDMIQRGAPVFPEEIEPLDQYLAKAFAAEMPKPVNVNTAPRAELEKLPGMKPELAARLLEARGKVGPFKNAEELRRNVKFDDAEFEAVRYLLKYAD